VADYHYVLDSLDSLRARFTRFALDSQALDSLGSLLTVIRKHHVFTEMAHFLLYIVHSGYEFLDRIHRHRRFRIDNDSTGRYCIPLALTTTTSELANCVPDLSSSVEPFWHPFIRYGAHHWLWVHEPNNVC